MDLWVYGAISDFYLYTILEKEDSNDRPDIKKILDSFEFVPKK